VLHAGDYLEFHCGANNDFYVQLPGGVFEGRDDLFLLRVNGPIPVPNPALKVMESISTHIINYVYDNSGHNCIPGPPDTDPPPDIIIQP